MDAFVAEIRLFPFTFAPKGWALCNGQLLPISQNTALFSLLGTFYGGDGKSTFGLPNLPGHVVMGPGEGPGLSDRFLGEDIGSDTATLLASEIPLHTHPIMASAEEGELATAAPLRVLAAAAEGNAYGPAGSLAPMAGEAVQPAGDSLPHNNLMPYLVLNYCIALQGIFPPRS